MNNMLCVLQAYVITEAENEQINSDDKSFQFLLKLLKAALATSDHYARGYGFSAIEVSTNWTIFTSLSFLSDKYQCIWFSIIL